MTQPADIIRAARFSLAIDGHEIASFTELRAIVTEIELPPHHHSDPSSGGPRTPKQLGTLKPATVVLKRGMQASLELWTWHDAALQGAVNSARRSCTLTMVGPEGTPVAKYWLEKAFPTKLELSGAGQTLVEVVTFVCEYVQRLPPT